MSSGVIATAVIEGPEARGNAALVRGDTGRVVLGLSDYWIAPGAPDVRVYLTPSADGDTDAEDTVDLGRVRQLTGALDLDVPPDVRVERMRVVVVLCKVYSVEFGRGTLRWSGVLRD